MTDETVSLDNSAAVHLGHYRVIRKLAAGGMGEVFLAEDTRLGRTAAVKVISPLLARDPELKRRFLGEAYAASKLNHPDIAVIYDLGETSEGTPFIGMEYVEGRTLAEVMGEPAPLARLLAYAIRAVDAVDEAHRHGIVHRDLKPQNVMITARDGVKVLDFGLAKMTGGAPAAENVHATRTGVIMGTVAYMSPEQARGQPVDPRSDIFSLGVILYQMATGDLPFQGASAFEVLEKVVRADPEPVAKRNPGAPPEIGRIVAKCLEKDPAQRYSSAAELRADLEQARARMTSSTAVSLAAPPERSRRWLAVALAGAILLAVAVVAIQRRGPGAAGGTGASPASPPAAAASETPVRAVAVLPFKSLSEGAEAESFADGMAVELINALSGVKGLRVASRTSSFAFKAGATDVREVATRLRVGSVLEGTVRTAGERIRVTVQLVDASNGYQEWSESFDRRLDDVFAIQDEIARAVVARVGGAAVSGLAPPPTANLAAYRAFVLGRSLAAKNSIASLRQAITSLEEALRLDPNMAAAQVEIARAYVLLVGRTGIAPEAGFPKAMAAAQKALALDPGLDAAHAALADVHAAQFQWAEAERHIRQAIALRPDSAEALRSHSRLLTRLGRTEEAVAAARKAYALDAANAGNLGRALFHARAYAEALATFQRALAEAPESAVTHFYVAMSLARLERFPEAVAAMEKAIDFAGDQRWRTHLAHIYALAGERSKAVALVDEVIAATPPVDRPAPDIAATYAALGDTERALQWLETGYATKPSDLGEINIEPDFDGLSDQPRFRALLAKIGVAR